MTLTLDNGTWVLGAQLPDGRGGFGAVYEVTGDDGRQAVAKLIPKDPGADRELLIGDLARVNGLPNIVPMLDKGEHGDSWVIVMPRASQSLARFLHDHSGPMSPTEAIPILMDIAIAIEGFAGVVVHRDLKPQNILLLDGTWCIADFGISRYAEATTAADTRKYSLTPPYAAPEQWRLERATSATDVYAFGVIAYQILSGRPPFEGPDFREQHLTAAPPALSVGSARLRSLVDECLFKRAEARPTAANVRARLSRASEEPALAGALLLADANHAEAQRRAAAQAEEMRAQERATFYADMHADGIRSLESIAAALLDAIEDNAPAATIEKDAGRGAMIFVATLGRGKFGISRPQQADEWQGPFTVISHAVLTTKLNSRNQYGWEGRSHSLWYCDAQERGRFAWYETAFMTSPLIRSSTTVEPFSSEPAKVGAILRGVVDTTQLAWPFEELDRDDLGEFLNRWLAWFASAAQGNLSRPRSMPEKPTGNSWRRT